uniref:(California timema) hypothetical protein n=1 Tax=Timema californicum TaxID=61474 RepID=A0A7R9PAW1_TIMCA|nr:unnamed protein product [Timema californicum]
MHGSWIRDEPRWLSDIVLMRQVKDPGVYSRVHAKAVSVVNRHNLLLLSGGDQGRVELWVDMFPDDDNFPPSVNITPRQPVKYELRVIVWNTQDVVLQEHDFLTGHRISDIFVKGFVFPFSFLSTEGKIEYLKKDSTFARDKTRYKLPCQLTLQAWDNDLISKDDYLGEEGKAELELQLMTREEADDNPVGLGRAEPEPLDKPNSWGEISLHYVTPQDSIVMLFPHPLPPSSTPPDLISQLLITSSLFPLSPSPKTPPLPPPRLPAPDMSMTSADSVSVSHTSMTSVSIKSLQWRATGVAHMSRQSTATLMRPHTSQRPSQTNLLRRLRVGEKLWYDRLVAAQFLPLGTVKHSAFPSVFFYLDIWRKVVLDAHADDDPLDVDSMQREQCVENTGDGERLYWLSFAGANVLASNAV